MEPKTRYVHVRLAQPLWCPGVEDMNLIHASSGAHNSCQRHICKQVRDLGSGSFGVAQLMRDMATGELVAIKKLERGSTVTLRPFA